MTVNKALSDVFAIRGSFDYVKDSGFIDYVNVVQEPGVSDPNPDFSDPSDVAANLRTVKDANGEEVLSGRIAARWTPSEAIDATLTYYYQESDIEGRQSSNHRGLVPNIGRYESSLLVEEPNEIKNDLLALEITADLGFAELTSATGYSNFEDDGQRDQTSLLITLEYSYEDFPTFTSLTREVGREERFNQEIRLVSQHGGPFSWIVGAFYNDLDEWASSSEFTPGYAAFAGFDRPDDLEYFDQSNESTVEKAVYGELSFDITDRLTATVGGRYYKYNVQAFSQTDFPLFDPGFVAPDLSQIRLAAFDPELAQKDDGTLFKANLSFQATDDLLLYATVSEGFRIGGSNGVGQCDLFDPDNPVQQSVCALALGQEFSPGGPGNISSREERFFGPDKTRNYELGFKSTLADGALTFNGALYYVDWIDPQLGSATNAGSQPITVNADGAESKGIELSADWRVSSQFRIRGNFSHTDSKLTAFAPALIRGIVTDAQLNDPALNNTNFSTDFVDGLDGDRLPGSPKNQFSLFATYDMPLENGSTVRFNGGYSYQGDVLSRAGGRGSSYTLPSYGTADFSIVYDADNWNATLFVENAFDKFAETGVVNTPLFNRTVQDINGETVYTRSYRHFILAPREIGIRFKYDFFS